MLFRSMLLIGLACVGGFYTACLAVFSYVTPAATWPAFIVTLVLFGSAVLLQIGAATIRHFFPMPPLQASPADRFGGRPHIDAATGTAVFFLALALIGMVIGAVLAVYTYSTPDALFPLFIGVLVCFVLALLVKVADAARRHFGGS